MNSPNTPESILPDGADGTVMNGQWVRKGTIAAFFANIAILENAAATEVQKQNAIDMMKSLAPAVIAIGLYQHVTFRNATAQQMLDETKRKSDV